MTIKIYGKVQGVFFRHSAREKAKELGIIAHPRNESDGTVVIEVEGDEQAIKQFTDWCRVGPPEARVEKGEIQLKKKNFC